jgi:hypothetical protein
MAFHPTGLTLLHQQAACQIVRGAFTLPYRDLAAARSIREPSAATLACPQQASARDRRLPGGDAGQSSVKAAPLLAGLGGLEEEQQLATRFVAIDFSGDIALEHGALCRRDLAALAPRRIENKMQPLDAALQFDARGLGRG